MVQLRRFAYRAIDAISDRFDHLVTDLHRPGRVHDDAEQEGAAGAWPVEQAGQHVHAEHRRRRIMGPSGSTMVRRGDRRLTGVVTEKTYWKGNAP